jgi:hypothetical protein
MRTPSQAQTETWTVGDRPRDVAIWTTDEWDALADDQRPDDAILMDGVGWVALLPEEGTTGDPPQILPHAWRPHPYP